jgi:CheY-like chemotaxis protein
MEENKSNPEKLPDVIFLDLNMPGFSGWEFLERMQCMLSGLNKDIQVYVLSSSLRPIDREISSKYSFVNEFISKPMESDEVERIVSTQYTN